MYEWFLDESASECVVLERYADSDGLLEHISHVGDALGALLDASEVSIEQLGDQSEKLLEVTRPYGPKVYWPF